MNQFTAKQTRLTILPTFSSAMRAQTSASPIDTYIVAPQALVSKPDNK